MSDMQHFLKYSYISGCIQCDVNLNRFSKQFYQAQQWLGDRVLEDCKPFMPHVTGVFQDNSKVLARGQQVLFPGPSARFLYMGKVMVDEDTGSPWARKGAKKIVTDRPITYSSPTATAFWFDAAKAANGDYWISESKRIAGGRK